MKMQFVVLSLLMAVTGPIQQPILLGQNNRAQRNFGTVVLNFDRSVLQGDARTLTALLTQPGASAIKKSVPTKTTQGTPTIRFDDVPAGDWAVTVRGENRSGVVTCSSTSSVSVVPNLSTVGTITLNPATFSFSWQQERIKWKMHLGNPILQQSEEGWDSEHYYFDDPTVVKRDGVYHMWYSSAANMRGDETFWIAYATSTDGITWTKHGPVFGPGSGGEWMEKGAISPAVIYDHGLFRMWFVGANNPLNYHNGIGYASSRDGKTWNVETEPVLPANSSMGATWNPSVVKKENLYYLFMGVSGSSAEYSSDVVLMTSLDGRRWQNRGVVFSARRDLVWQRSGILPCEVLYDENRFKMFFSAMDAQTFSIGYAESREGINWFGLHSAPLLGPADTAPWSTRAVGFPAVLRDEGKLKMWFSAITKESPRYQIGYAEEAR